MALPPSNTPNKRLSMLARQRLVADRYLHQHTQVEIATEFDVTQATISKDLQTIRAAWLDSTIRDFDHAKAQELARIDTLEREYWDAWIASKGAREISAVKMINNAPTEQSLRTEGSSGDPRFLQGIQWCIGKRCEILGLDAPIKMITLTKDISDMSDAELDHLIEG